MADSPKLSVDANFKQKRSKMSSPHTLTQRIFSLGELTPATTLGMRFVRIYFIIFLLFLLFIFVVFIVIYLFHFFL
jgi:hypothetical protein